MYWQTARIYSQQKGDVIMSDFDNNNRGAVWGNSKKMTDNHPDLTGSIMVDGKDYWLSGWKRKEGANPKSPALSLSVTLKDTQQTQSQPTAAPKADSGFDEADDIPF